MPIYEYRCAACGRKSTFVTLSVSARLEPKCQHCGSPDVRKLVSRVGLLKSEGGRADTSEDPDFRDVVGGDGDDLGGDFGGPGGLPGGGEGDFDAGDGDAGGGDEDL